MKRLTVLILLLAFVPVSHGITGKEILEKMDIVGDYKTARMEATMKIIDRKGNETTMTLESYEMKEGDRSLMRFTSPARLKGTAILMVGDSIWYYNNRTNRVRLLSKSAKKGSMMGSSFSYEDMAASYKDDYTAELLDENKKEYIIKIIPRENNKSYKYMKARVDRETFISTEVEYYDSKELKYKIMTADNIKDIDGHIAPLSISMKELSSQKVTEFVIDEENVEYDIKIDERMFSERNLKR